MRTMLAVMALAGCRSTASSHAVTVDAGPAVSATPITSASPWDPLRDAQKDLARWNEAHVKHDTKVLAELYGTNVRFYGQPLSGDECVKRKAAAFAKAPNYTQSIRNARLNRRVSGEIDVTFVKHTSQAGKSADFDSTLTFGSDVNSGERRITAESDTITDARTNISAARWCLDAEGLANDVTRAPFKLSAMQAAAHASTSRHYKDRISSMPWGSVEPFIQGPDACPSECLPNRGCGYTFKMTCAVVSSEPTGMTVYFDEAFYVNAQDGTMAFKDDKDVWTNTE